VLTYRINNAYQSSLNLSLEPPSSYTGCGEYRSSISISVEMKSYIMLEDIFSKVKKMLKKNS